jgi:transposase
MTDSIGRRAMRWAESPQRREQIVLFSERLDDALPPNHVVRLVDEILSQLSWSRWESRYHGRLGQPPIHPRVLASVLLYGMLMRIRSSRALEEALVMRMDFRWLVEGRSLDHTTISEFRRKYPAELKGLFVQICQVAREMGLLSLQRLAFDGTRVRANNRKSGTRTPEHLRRRQAEFEAKFAEFAAQAEAEDTRDEEAFGLQSPQALPDGLADAQRRRQRLANALAALDRLDAAGEAPPKRLPITDPESRVMPNKEGGFAPNSTPTATVDVESGLIVEATVLGVVNEAPDLIQTVEAVQQQFGLAELPKEVLADGLMATGANLAAVEARGITLYSPCPLPDPAKNPALRDLPTQPVPPEQWKQLPMKKTKGGTQLDKSAFVYDADRDCYWCPLGKPLPHATTTHEARGSRQRIRRRYQASPQDCAGCPLRERCLQGKAEARLINLEQYEAHRERHAQRMSTPEAQKVYALRRHVGERPFAVIKHVFGLRRFFLRGLEGVQTEWQWAVSAFNLHRLMALVSQSRAGPAAALSYSP